MMNSSAIARFARVGGAPCCAGRMNLPTADLLPARRDRSGPQSDRAIDLDRVLSQRACLLYKTTNFMVVLLSLFLGDVQFSNWLSHLSNVLNQTKVSKELFRVCLPLLPLLPVCNRFNIQYKCNVQCKLKSLKSSVLHRK